VSKEHIALAALAVTLLGLVWTGGQRLGEMTTTIQTLSKELSLVRTDLSAINTHFVEYTLLHRSHAGE
jgi:hypothetical protein